MKGKRGHDGHEHERHRKDGGRLDMKVSGNPDVFKEADERRHGGKVKKKKELGHPEGKMARHRRDRARGGDVRHKHESHEETHRARGGHAHHEHDEERHHRASGGRVGADRRPFSSARASATPDSYPKAQD